MLGSGVSRSLSLPAQGGRLQSSRPDAVSCRGALPGKELSGGLSPAGTLKTMSKSSTLSM